MLVIISDLHFTDGSTSNKDGNVDLFNIHPNAFRLFLSKISNIVSRRKKQIQKITFIYNGDIFDIIRTYAWFHMPENHRPWSVPLAKREVYEKCNDILYNVMRHNDEALAWLNGQHPDFSEVWQVEKEIERVYIPGNHDRIINLHPPCRRQVHAGLLGNSGNGQFENKYMDLNYQTLVMHGHESDAFNCEFASDGTPQYADAPIGDPLTTMLFVLLGYRANFLSIPGRAKNRFREIDNVRPHLAGIRFVQDIITDFHINDQVAGMLRRLTTEFENLDFYKNWLQAHDKLNLGFDEADKLQFALRTVQLAGPSIPAGLLEKLADLVRDEYCSKLAKRILKKAAGGSLRYCVMGHTHEPLHVPLYVDQKRNMEKHYLNCGTFRSTFALTHDRRDFLKFQRMSFVIVYGPNEFSLDEQKPVYELWSGLRMHH